MNSGEIKLIEPAIELKAEFLAMAEEFKAEGADVINGVGCIEPGDFENSVKRAKEHVDGIGLPEGWVPASTYWLVRDEILIGTCNLRHELNVFLENYGGHIGYSVRRSQRNKGYGTQMLRFALQKARDLGIERALVTCDDNNIASARTIEKNGGKLADKVKTEYAEYLIRRYWIEL
ncbi:MAG: GNAT family N-acetyltransferase [Planctomycetota bacterium]